jgi:organic radical activating enzyme
MGFNNPDKVKITNEVLGFDPAEYNNLKELPLIKIGCDSLYAHDKRFAHLWHEGNEDDLAKELVSLLPHKQWCHPITGLPYIFSITGGEPTLFAKTIPTLLNHSLMNDLKIVLIETNCSVPLSDTFMEELDKWIKDAPGRKIIWSNSPKLSVSGEPFDKAIRPDIALKQLSMNRLGEWKFEQYFKFVCGANKLDFDEVSKVMDMYYDAGVSRDVQVGIMPESATAQQQIEIAQQVADMCIERGYLFVLRLQNVLWGNEIGT